MIVESEGAEAAGDPAQTFSGWMRIAGTRIKRAHNLAEQNKSRISELVFSRSKTASAQK